MKFIFDGQADGNRGPSQVKQVQKNSNQVELGPVMCQSAQSSIVLLYLEFTSQFWDCNYLCE